MNNVNLHEMAADVTNLLVKAESRQRELRKLLIVKIYEMMEVPDDEDKETPYIVELNDSVLVDIYADPCEDFEPAHVDNHNVYITHLCVHPYNGLVLVTMDDDEDDVEDCEYTLEHLSTYDLYNVYNELESTLGNA